MCFENSMLRRLRALEYCDVSPALLPKSRDLAEVILLYYVCVSVVQYVLLDQ